MRFVGTAVHAGPVMGRWRRLDHGALDPRLPPHQNITAMTDRFAKKTSVQVHRPCPRCGSTRIHRSRHRTFWERILPVTGAWIRRCHDCDLRFIRLLGITLRMDETGVPRK